MAADSRTQTHKENFRGPLNKSLIVFTILAPIAGVGLAAYLAWNHTLSLTDILLFAGFYSASALGITVGYHRYLTHGSFKSNRIVKILFVILGSIAIEGGPFSWVANHRQHHAFADQEGDPHSPVLSKGTLKGLYHAHIGWMIRGFEADPNVWAKDLLRDKDMVVLNRVIIIFPLAALALAFLLGGWTGLLWGGAVRIFLAHHVTWAVNSVCHMYGSRPFKTRDASTNNWLVGLLGFGEGGHNTHHASPRSARHGLHWWHFDLSYMLILSMEKAKLASHVYSLDSALVKNAIEQGSPYLKAVARRTIPRTELVQAGS